MLKINYLYFKRAETAPTNRANKKILAEGTEGLLIAAARGWEPVRPGETLQSAGGGGGPGEAPASARGVCSEPTTGPLALEALLPETGHLPAQAAGR